MPPTMSAHTTTTSNMTPVFEAEQISNHRRPSGSTDEKSSTSILSTMNNFVKAVNEMDDTILIPSRLRDMDTSDTITPNPSGADGDKALVSTQQNTDMLAYYHMLNAVKTELVHGPGSGDDESEEMEQEEEDQSSHVAHAFRHHLQGLFSVLKQLTGSAKLLTSKYQEEIGELASSASAPSNLSTFTL